MKFRMGFVTNSSSYSSIMIAFENEKLIKILNQYESLQYYINRDRFYFMEGETFVSFEKRVDSFESFLSALDLLFYQLSSDDEYFSNDEYMSIKKDIALAKKEILKNFTSISFEYQDYANGSETECLYEDMLQNTNFKINQEDAREIEYTEKFTLKKDGDIVSEAFFTVNSEKKVKVEESFHLHKNLLDDKEDYDEWEEDGNDSGTDDLDENKW